jgi:hypothetical protein
MSFVFVLMFVTYLHITTLLTNCQWLCLVGSIPFPQVWTTPLQTGMNPV